MLPEAPFPVTRPGAVVVFSASNGEVKHMHDGIVAGADDCIVKPFNEAALQANLEKSGWG
ncbi:MAG: hypothetical protein H2049_12550 [Porphyrobacter sp.]|nr:hypothetical protein [Porphyrobacter sp.]